MGDKAFNPNLIDAGEHEIEDADIEIQKIKLKKKAGLQGLRDMPRLLHHILYSGSGTKQEIVELEQNMRDMIEEGKYGYKYMEDWLISLGYPLVAIREIFKRLTGVSVEDWMDVGKVLDVPASIPGINYGWGAAKGKDFDFYFIMPYNLGYSIFGQKGDIHREECYYHRDLASAREQLDKLTTGANYWDKPVKVKDIKEFPMQNMSEPRQEIALTASQKAIDIDNYLYNHFDELNSDGIKGVLLNAKLNGDLNDVEYNYLTKAYLEVEAGPDIEKVTPTGEEDVAKEMQDKVHDMEEKELAKPFEESIGENTPSQYFENSVKELKKETIPADIIDKILGYVKEKNESLKDFEVFVQSFKYTSVETVKDAEKTVKMDDQTKEKFFEANALVSLLLRIADNTLPANLQEKLGLVIFSIVDSEIVTPDYIKGEDNDLYALTEEGLNKYFSKEREQYEQRGGI
jgi:hypothetical protein